MKKIKHSKFKNTGILFELLVRQITLEILNGDKEVAKGIVKEFFKTGTELSKEKKLYDMLLKETYMMLVLHYKLIFNIIMKWLMYHKVLDNLDLCV